MTDDLTTELERALHARADDMHGSLLALGDVQQRARSIRRRRSATAVGGAVLAMALVLPVAVLVGRHGHSSEPLPAVTHSVSPSPTTGTQPPDGVLDASDLPTGAAPGVEYVTDGRTLHLADGGTVDLPTQYPVDSFVTLQDGSHVFQTIKDARAYVEVEDGDGGFLAPVRSDWGLAVNAAHTIAAWTTSDGQVHVFGVGDSAPAALGRPITDGYDRGVAAVTGDDCATACTVYVNVSGESGGLPPWEVSTSGSRRLADGGLLGISGVSPNGLMIGLSHVDDNGSCSKLVGGGEFPGFRTCRAALESFSPDGTTILGDPPYFDGLGPTSVSMWSLDGKQLFERQADPKHQATIATTSWEDDTHLLATVYQGGSWSVVRIGVDGSLSYAVQPVAGHDVDNPFVLATGGAVPSA